VSAKRLAAFSILLSSAAFAVPACADSLADSFKNPPNSARPRVWWHWMNGNITKDGIAKDMAWMKRVGIGGLQNFDAQLQTPQIVDKRLVYMTPEWKDAFAFAAQEADRQGLELAIAASPGWSETGGPWVPPEDGLKKLVWSETDVVGGKPFMGKLAAPPSVTGPFQSIPKQASIDELLSGSKVVEAKQKHYADVAVLAFPIPSGATLPQASVTGVDGKPLDSTLLTDDDLASALEITTPTTGQPGVIALTYATPQTVRSARIFLPGASVMFFGASVKPTLEASDDGKTWRTVADIPAMQVPTSVSFAPVTASHFRFLFKPVVGNTMSNMGEMSPGADLGALGGMSRTASGLKIGELRLSAEAGIDRFEAKAGFEIESDYYALSQSVPESKGVALTTVINLTSRLRADGTLNWTPPVGNWRVVRLGASLLGTENHPAPKEATGLEVDKFDGAAVRRYLEHYIAMYRDASGGMFGKRGVQAILTDSIEVGAANWTPKMIEQFKKLRGYDPVPWMPSLTGTIIGSRAESDRFLYDYRRTLADLMASEHYGTVATVAHEHGLKVYGEALEDHRPSLGDDMSMRTHADIPMAAMWTHSRAAGPRPSYLADIKGAASVAHIYGQNLVAAESMTSALNYWNDSPATLKRIIDLEFVTGVNRPVIHTSVHQPRDDKFPGLSLFIFGQYFNRHESWAEMAKPWVDYLSRNALMLQQGRNVADVAYFYGEEAPLTGLYGDKRVADAPLAHAYDFVNFDALMGALKNDGTELVTPGGARYRALYLGGSSRMMTLTALRRITALVEGGATVVGKKPEGSPSQADNPAEFIKLADALWDGEVDRKGSGRVFGSADINAALAQIGVAPDFRYSGGTEGADIPFLHRKFAAKDGGGDSYYLVNRNDRAETIEAHFRVTGKRPELWHAETGTLEAVDYMISGGETVVPLSLASEESVHVVFRKPATSDDVRSLKVAQSTLATLDGAWTIKFLPDRRAPATTTLPQLAPLNENADPGIKYFSGIATYTKDFTAPKGWKAGQPLWIDLGSVKELAEVSVNGKAAGAAWHAPYRVDISGVAKRGKNKLEVRVANLWVNRLIGDAQPGATKSTFTAMPTYRADAPLRPSGLIGPVTLEGETR
jgi:alpha-L-rhamnosidase